MAPNRVNPNKSSIPEVNPAIENLVSASAMNFEDREGGSTAMDFNLVAPANQPQLYPNSEFKSPGKVLNALVSPESSKLVNGGIEESAGSREDTSYDTAAEDRSENEPSLISTESLDFSELAKYKMFCQDLYEVVMHFNLNINFVK